MIGNPLLLGPEGYQISRSVRLRSSASAYFNRTPGSATNRRTMTLSMWQKRGEFGSTQEPAIMWAGTNSSNYTLFRWGDGVGNSDSKFKLNLNMYTGSTNINLITTPVYRDPSGWYHIVLSIDTTQATAANRVRLYINGTEVTAFSSATYPSQNLDLLFNSTNAHEIGRFNFGSYLDGYMTEVNFVDGQQLTPSSFGETDILTGVWKPKKYGGTYGTNGFYLNFSDNSSNTATTIGKDYSGNGNNWTPNNISVTSGSTYDSMLDVPTQWADGGNGRGNYSVLNPIGNPNGTIVTFSNGNLDFSHAASVGNAPKMTVMNTISLSSGKWYWEFSSGATVNHVVGISTEQSAGGSAYGSGYAGYTDGGVFIGTYTNPSSASSYTTNDVIGMAYDQSAGTLAFYKNNVLQGTTTNISTTATNFTLRAASSSSTGGSGTFNFGQRPFAYTPPTGFKALNTQNLPVPTILRGDAYMNATTYTGNGSTQSIVNAGGMQPDLVWVKNRTQAYNHILQDSVRGTGVYLSSSTTDADQSTSTAVTAFNSNGFSIGSIAGANFNGNAIVAWQWQAGKGTTVSNTSGSITSTVSANTTAGFSVVTYTGIGSAATVGHGLGVAPKMMIVKTRNSADIWCTYTATTGAGNYLALNSTAASTANTAVWNNTAPTSSVFSIAGSAATGTAQAYVAYLFAEVAGFSRFGSYSGNGSSDGPFVFCGFRPAFVMVKRSDAVASWIMWDSKRDTYNIVGNELVPNSSGAEAAGSNDMDFTSNGFKLRNTYNGTNASGGTYIFAAFAEVPQKFALAR